MLYFLLPSLNIFITFIKLLHSPYYNHITTYPHITTCVQTLLQTPIMQHTPILLHVPLHRVTTLSPYRSDSKELVPRNAPVEWNVGGSRQLWAVLLLTAVATPSISLLFPVKQIRILQRNLVCVWNAWLDVHLCIREYMGFY